ncbi:MAG TPA: exodeoxyribonuclease V subunit gamma [Spirochaetes bacterium]|nr:exodeoxyribonuclease V subunit gamma [Spirochaetota bacterium]
MPGIQLYSSSRLESLADRLAGIVGENPRPPLEEEIIVVEPIGMERWLSQRLSVRLGAWANCRYPFPNKMLEYLFETVLPGEKEDPLLGEKVLAWRLFSLLPDLARDKDFIELRNYLAGDDRQLKRFQLSRKLADTFFQYMTYRPAMVLEWETNKDTHWQARLWRRLLENTGGLHRARLLRLLCEKLEAPGLFSDFQLPPRINLFGISALPPMHLEALRAAAGHCDVNVFFLNPCREYWADVKNEWERMRLEGKDPGAELHVERGNVLLASLGKTGRDFLWMLLDRDADFEGLEDGGDDEGADGETLLRVIQNDILFMRDRGGDGDGSFSPAPAAPVEMTTGRLQKDDSLRVASCHSPMREVEALYDYLLGLFDNDPTLEPRDILIMTPDIETYAPLAQAVFGSPEELAAAIPYAVADRGPRGRSPLVRAFFQCLDCACGRFGAGQVMDLLLYPDIRRRFGLETADIDALGRRVAGAGIRWGIDGAHRQSMDLPAEKQNTWRAGIERLLLGYAMPADGLFMEILPFDEIEGSAARETGKLITFIETLGGLARELAHPRSPSGWELLLSGALDGLFAPDEASSREMNSLRDAVKRFAEEAALSGLDEPVEFDVARSWLLAELDVEKTAKNFLSGRVTVCAMRPMRSVPFRVLCLLGMNDGVFPRNPPAPGFDLMAAAPRRGERSVRDEDRFLFLETLISARDKLYISYLGQSIQDNSPLPPSPVVSELLDYCEHAFRVEGAVVKDLLFVEHPLQAFSPRYFTGERKLYSYSRRNHAAAGHPGANREKPPFIDGPLPPPALEEISLEMLAGFYRQPARVFLRERLGMRLDEARRALEEKEPFDIAGLDAYNFGNGLCRHLLEGRPPEEYAALLRGEGRFPHGVPGDTAFQRLLPGVRAFAERVARAVGGGPVEHIDLWVPAAGVYITGNLGVIVSRGQVIYDYGSGSAKRRISAWLRHLALNAAADAPCPRETVLICRDVAWRMGPLKEGNAVLGKLAALYLAAMEEPPPYFPESSLACAAALWQGKPVEAALREARLRWEGNRSSKGPRAEGDDPSNHQLTGGELSLDGRFVELAREIFFPMLDGQVEL